MEEHHAILLLGPHEVTYACLPSECQKAHVDVYQMTCDTFGIKDARALKERASSRPVIQKRRCFVIITHEILRGAQHALLKLFEDPPETAKFYVLLAHDQALLPTLRSRFHIQSEYSTPAPEEDVATAFLKMKAAERFEEIKKRVEAKDDTWMRALLRGLERHFSARSEDSQHKVLRELLMVEGYMNTRGASKKMLLEHVALTVPETP